ncbi:MAG: phosphoglycolate phosphatase [Pseudomonadota bacterium]
MSATWPRAVIFDLDGTLVDSLPDLANALGQLFREEGLEPLPVAALKPMVGRGLGFLVERAFASVAAPLPSEALDRCRAHYLQTPVGQTVLYPGMRAVLERLKQEGCQLAVCTNKPADLARAILDEMALTPFFAMILGGDSLAERKPHPGPLLHILDTFALTPDQAVMVGDSPPDAEAAQAAGLRCVLCRYGYSTVPVETLGADAIIDQAEELLLWLSQVGSGLATVRG